MKRTGLVSGIIILTFLVLAGCQKNPVLPGINDSTDPHEASSDQAGSHQCLGYYSLILDTETLEISSVPLRSAEWHFNLTGILNTTMGISVAFVPGQSDPVNGLVVLDVTLSHPFATKPQLSGFDVKGILMTPGSLVVSPLVFADVDETCLENTDGYTRWWNPTEFTTPGMFGYTHGNLANAPGSLLTATVNPYKLFADILDATDSITLVSDEPLTSANGRAVFKAGESNTRRYSIRFPLNPGPQIVYGYAVDCAWGAPSPNPPASVPNDFPIEANQPEAYRIAMAPTVNCLYYDSESGIGGGVLKVLVNVHDWQGQAAGNIPSEVSAVRFFAPDLMTGSANGIFLNETPLKARYTCDLSGSVMPSQAGEAKLICRVGSSDGSTYKQAGAPAPEDPLSAFQVISVDIIDPDCTVDTNNDFNEAMNMGLEEVIVDELCAPTDYKDYYKLIIPLGFDVSGDLILHCDREPTTFGLYDDSEVLISEVSVSGGTAVLDFDALGIMPGTYYIRVLTQTSDVAFLYAIEPALETFDTTPNATLLKVDGLNLAPIHLTSHGNIVYATGNRGFWIYDWTDCNDPTLLSYTVLSASREPVLDYPYMFVTRALSTFDSRIDVIDVSNPASPQVTQNILELPVGIKCMAIEEGYLFLGTSYSEDILEIYDISSDPATPTHLNSIPLADLPKQMEILHQDGGPNTWLAVRYTFDPRIDTFNITNMASIPAAQEILWGPGSTLNHMTVDQDRIYALLEDDGGDPFLVEILVIPSTGPAYQGSEPLTSEPRILDKHGDYVYIHNVNMTMTAVDVSIPGSPVEGSIFSVEGLRAYGMETFGTVLLFAYDGAGIGALTIENPASPMQCGRQIGLGLVAAIDLDGDYLYCLENYTASQVFVVKSVNISDPAHASVECELRLIYAGNTVVADQGRMFVLEAADEWVEQIDCSDPANMVSFGITDMSIWISAIEFYNDVCYICQGDNTLHSWDISNWPVVGTHAPDSLAWTVYGFAFRDDAMYVVADNDVQVFSIVNPLFPVFVQTYGALGDVTGIAVQDDYLYIATKGSLEIADISDPLSPAYVAAETHPDAPNGRFIAVEGQIAILPPSGATPTVMRVWPADDPTVLGPLYDTEYMSYLDQVLINDGYYYECRLPKDLRIWDLY